MKTLKLIIACFLVSAYSFANVTSNEKEALIALYNTTNGSEWNVTWDLNTSVDTWHGIQVEDNKMELS